jgi:hypothetical protein
MQSPSKICDWSMTFKKIKHLQMKTQLDISALLEAGKIQNELDFERALIADRKLRILAKEDPKYKGIRKKLRDLLQDYENKNWSANSKITVKKFKKVIWQSYLPKKNVSSYRREKS